MTIAMDPKLRFSLGFDAVVSGAFGLLSLGVAGVIASLTGLPSALILWAGLLAAVWSAGLFLAASRPSLPRPALIGIVAGNLGWTAASFAVLALVPVSPTLLGYAFVIAQAAVVALFAFLQSAGLRLPDSVRA